MNSARAVRRWLVAILLAALAGMANAHKASDSYLTLEVTNDGASGRWDIALRDLDFALVLDADGNGEITWGEVRTRHADIAAYARAHLAVTLDERACDLAIGEQLVDRHTDGSYSVLPLALTCPARVGGAARLAVRYSLFADLDPQHRGLLNLQARGQTRTAILVPGAAAQSFELEAPSLWAQFIDYLNDGIWHIWTGFDHVLFLLSLLLPSVLTWQGDRWRAVQRTTDAFWEVFRIVTAFTIAHSITLSLAVLRVIELPSRFVESVIAASVVLAALNNVRPVVLKRLWLVAFGFGLVHGFGFASVLLDLGLPAGALAIALAGFNVGVEIGQLAIVAVFLPLALALRHATLYRRWVLIGGSLAIAALAMVWLVERSLDVRLLF